MEKNTNLNNEMTNEDWFNTLNTEEKAIFLANFYRHNGDKLIICVKLEGKFYPEQKRTLVEWLKEKHSASIYDYIFFKTKQ